jgi:basic amino acid/polyamine antiporter, APA family
MTVPQRHLTLFDAVCIIVGVIIGAGIFEIAPRVASATNSTLGVVGFWVLGGFLSLCGALCYAELATAYPRAGGDYEYLTRAYGPRAGFLFGWFLVTLIRPGDIALLALVFARYALAIAPDLFDPAYNWFWYRAIAIVGVLGLTYVNVLGVRQGKRVQNSLTTIKVLSVLAVVLLAFIGTRQVTRPAPVPDSSAPPEVSSSIGDDVSEESNGRGSTPAAVVPTPLENHTASTVEGTGEEGGAEQSREEEGEQEELAEGERDGSGAEPATVAVGATFGLALILVLFSYGGWNEMAFLAAEMEHPERNILRGLVIGACGVMAIYVLMNLSFVYALGLDGLSASEAVAVDAVAGALPTVGQSLISAAICISALGAVSGLIFAGSRIAYALGQDYPLFSFLGKWHPGSETPMRSLIFQATITSAMILVLGDFLDTLIYTSAAVYCFFLATCVSVIVLRWKDPHVPRPYRVVGYPFTVIIFGGACLFLLYSAITYKPQHGVALLGMLLLGCLVYMTQGVPKRLLPTENPANESPRLLPFEQRDTLEPHPERPDERHEPPRENRPGTSSSDEPSHG